jgi:hypothetical protein
MGNGSFPGVKRPGHVVDHPIPSSADIKERVVLLHKYNMKFTLRIGYEGPEGEYSFFNLSATLGWVVNATLPPLYPRETHPVPVVG